MTKPLEFVETDYGESTLTTKGQTTLPSALRLALKLDTGDRLRWRVRADGTLIAEPRKRRSIVDIAKANPIRLGEAGLDLDSLIDEAVDEAMADKERRRRGASSG